MQKNSRNKIEFLDKYFSESEKLCCKQVFHSNGFTNNINNFNQHAKFILIDQLDNINLHKDLAILRLIKRKDFWILRLKTLHMFN